MGDGEVRASGFVLDLFRRNSRVHAHFRGRGQTINGGQTAEDYDATTAYDVLRAGGTQDDARSAVLARPDAHARVRGAEYLRDLLARAQRDAGDGAPEDEPRGWLQVSRLTIYASDRPRYVMETELGPLECSAGDIVARSAFVLRCVSALHRIPRLPSQTKGAFAQWMDGHLSRATVIDEPDEVSEDGATRDEVDAVLAGMGDGETNADLDRGLLLVVPVGDPPVNRRVLRMRSVVDRVHSSLPTVRRQQVSSALRALGWTPNKVRFDGRQVRVWSSPDEAEVEPIVPRQNVLDYPGVSS